MTTDLVGKKRLQRECLDLGEVWGRFRDGLGTAIPHRAWLLTLALVTALLTALLTVAPLTVANPRDPAHRKRGVTRRQRAQRVRHSAQRVRHSEQPSTLSTSNKPQRTPSGCKRSLQRQRQRQRCSLQRQRQRWPIAAPADRYRRLLQPRLHVMAAILQTRRPPPSEAQGKF